MEVNEVFLGFFFIVVYAQLSTKFVRKKMDRKGRQGNLTSVSSPYPRMITMRDATEQKSNETPSKFYVRKQFRKTDYVHRQELGKFRG